MCCRYLLTQEHLRAILERLGIPTPGLLPPTRYNIPPGGAIPAIRNASAGRELAALRWGLVPSWARSADDAPVNARAESLADKPSFREAFRRRRCLIPASGFYEWEARGRVRRPWLFRRRDGEPFGLAGLWETSRGPEGDVLESCAVVTTAPNALMEPIHHRMPVVLAAEQWDAWLDPRATDPAALAPLLRPWPAESMTALAVSDRVNHVRHDDPACLEPATTGGEPERQGELFA